MGHSREQVTEVETESISWCFITEIEPLRVMEDKKCI